MSTTTVLVLATLETKADETDYLTTRLAAHDTTAQVIDISLASQGAVLDGAAKLAAMDRIVADRLGEVTEALAKGAHAVVGMGGGTGGEIALRIMQALPITFPKVLVTTLPFDPRVAIADSSIILVPTLADICGLNPTLREVFENTAALTAGLTKTRRQADACVAAPSTAITGLGATEGAVQHLVQALRARGEESTVFHSNGYGGAAFARFARRGAFHTVIDLSPHEVTRLEIAGAHVPMPDRFSAAPDLPRILLPGAVNFIGLGEKSLLPEGYLARPHYAHSSYFTHVKLTPEEMAQVAKTLAQSLNVLTGPAALIVPMGGFSHQDRSGGAIEDPALRRVFLDQVSADLSPDVALETVDAHICAPETTRKILETLDGFPPAPQKA